MLSNSTYHLRSTLHGEEGVQSLLWEAEKANANLNDKINCEAQLQVKRAYATTKPNKTCSISHYQYQSSLTFSFSRTLHSIGKKRSSYLCAAQKDKPNTIPLGGL